MVSVLVLTELVEITAGEPEELPTTMMRSSWKTSQGREELLKAPGM
jgi:hypothetical protein